MRIVSLEPYLTELLLAFDLGNDLAGVSEKCVLPKEFSEVARINLAENQIGPEKLLLPELTSRPLNLTALKQIKPDTIVGSVYKSPLSEDVSREDILKIQARLSVNIGHETKLISYAPRKLEEIFEGLKDFSRQLKVPHKGQDTGGKIKAQIMNWADNFYERIKNKKVSFISSINPLRLAGYWIPDMISMLSAHAQYAVAGTEDKDIKWEDLLDFRPDVIIVAPRGYNLKESMSSFKTLENNIGWDEIPAVKRGEVVFADGSATFYYPGNSMIDSAAILVSGIAGFESGYITPRDTFYRLRWLELQRHKI